MVANRHVALVRGINVGGAKRVPMAELRALVEGLGGQDVATLLNSGNVVFTAPSRATPTSMAARIEKSLAAELGVSARVIVLTAAEVGALLQKHPFPKIAHDPARLLVAVLADARDRALLAPLLERTWGTEALALGPRAAYLWCGEGILKGELWKAVNRVLKDGVTSRNWATMQKLSVLAQGPA